MFTFISIMAVGVLIGYPLRHKSQVRKITPLIHIVVCLLLFLLGLSIGLNRLIIDNLGYFCGQAAVISSLSILGSMMASLAAYHILGRTDGKQGNRRQKSIKTKSDSQQPFSIQSPIPEIQTVGKGRRTKYHLEAGVKKYCLLHRPEDPVSYRDNASHDQRAE